MEVFYKQGDHSSASWYSNTESSCQIIKNERDELSFLPAGKYDQFSMNE